jgi:hypothetical protein
LNRETFADQTAEDRALDAEVDNRDRRSVFVCIVGEWM